MRSRLLVELLAKLDVARSFSRPHTSNDNPFSESAFKTMKYNPSFRREFHSDVDARAFCKPYFDRYNSAHHHAGIATLTPADVLFLDGGKMRGRIYIHRGVNSAFTAVRRHASR